MSIIRITGDLNYNKWIQEDFNLDPREVTLQIGFKSIVHSEDYIEFFKLKFGFFLYDLEDNIIQVKSFPDVGVEYHSSDQPYIEQIPLEVSVNKTYKIHVWAENAGAFYDYKTELNVPKFLKPFDSWLWDDENNEWYPPSPYPNDGKFYMWNEKDKEWKFKDISEIIPNELNEYIS